MAHLKIQYIAKINPFFEPFSFPSDFQFDDRMHNTLPASDGVEDICTTIYIRSNRNVFHIWSDTHWIFGGSANTCSGQPINFRDERAVINESNVMPMNRTLEL